MNLHKLKEEHMEQSEELKLMATRVSREAQGRKAKVGRLPGSALRPWPGFSQRFSLTPLSFDFVRASGSVAAHATSIMEGTDDYSYNPSKQDWSYRIPIPADPGSIE
ncbi:hypothetical protein VTJ04DRAFT_5614 [Mycothermus thermophilus]|uniref:uncharacterized protein n=1 Tax=Humicola insolens TaxID=85995 RepID=UPI0037430FBA